MTNAMAGAEIETRSVTWQFMPGEAASEAMTLPYAVVGGQPDKLLLTGLGERDVAGIAERLSENGLSGLAVASLVYPAVTGRLTASAVEQSIVKGTEALVRDITGNGGGLQQIIGNSEGASQALIAASKKPELYGQVVAVAPLINSQALGDTPRRQAKELKKRFGEAGLAVFSNGGFSKELVQEFMGGLEYADSEDPQEIAGALRGMLKVYIGERDAVVPPAEAEAAIGPDIITRVPGMGHPTLMDEDGIRQVALIARGEYTAGIVK